MLQIFVVISKRCQYNVYKFYVGSINLREISTDFDEYNLRVYILKIKCILK